MWCRTIRWALVLMSAALTDSATWGQFGGSRAGVESHAAQASSLPLLDREVVESFIAIDGRAEIRVRPTELRIVLAVTSEGQTAAECQAAIADSVQQLKTTWAGMGIPPESMVEDFIAVLPQYQWEIEQRGTGEFGVEKKAGYRMQTNLHLAVPNDANAAKAFTAALEQGITDIIAFDYWARDLDDVKVKAREQAVQAARRKADQLFNVLFDAPPAVINVQEQTTTHSPESLYHAFVNSSDQEVTGAWRRDIPFIRAHRPNNTYYRGHNSDGDVQPRALPMEPEISVVSTVRLYYQSPAATLAKEAVKSGDK